jgi:RHH-type proline utilization regulon transcriptional repressor/proline dehydrogenase/delta 1-pyrroline-5-carboxylate dehydrogenase
MPDRIYKSLMQSEEEAVQGLLSTLKWDETMAGSVQDRAVGYIQAIRKTRRKPASLESFFNQYGLDTKEGLALMSMAEALLRIPDPHTAGALIRDKVSGTNWLKAGSKDKDWMTRAAGVGLKLSSDTMGGLFSKLGEPIIREAMGKAMVLLGKQFVVGENIPKAMRAASNWEEKGFRFSYDVLGEGARTMRDAENYFEGYIDALKNIAEKVENLKEGQPRPGISVKLSALHPRYETLQHEFCVPALTEKLTQLCEIAAAYDIGLTVDAEEVARLPLSLVIFENVLNNLENVEWDGFGLAVQAYHKAAGDTIQHIIELAKQYNRKLQIRLVKGAYWDTEIKHAQVEGHNDYAVFTRKSNTDLSYLRCAQKMLRNRDVLYPMFGTHNAHSVAAILEIAGDQEGYEFQKLYGMGDALYKHMVSETGTNVCVYAPVGPFHDLLPYLVRRMLENGANSSFVNQIYDKEFHPEEIAEDPVAKAKRNEEKHHPKISLPKNIFDKVRKNSSGIDLDNPIALKKLTRKIEFYKSQKYNAMPLIGGKKQHASLEGHIVNPADNYDDLGNVYIAQPHHINEAYKVAKTGHKIWSQTPADQRAAVLERLAILLEENAEEIIALTMREAGRTLKDCIDEVREAVDFCRYYAAQGRLDFNEAGRSLKSPTGETNIYTLHPRGIFVCISPWNFPVAIYIGQISAALMAGNSVIAKPAEQTSLIGYHIAKLILKAGVPPEAFSFIPGDGYIGAALVEHDDVAGVVFTGSTQTAQIINQTLAVKENAIPKLIAETGGQNAMIVDSSALTEQVIDDVVQSAFGSAGQRCSACRLLYIQEDVVDKTILMLQGAIQELKIGQPLDIETDIGPLIDEESLMNVQAHKTRLEGFSRKIAEAPMDPYLRQQGNFFAPLAVEIKDLENLHSEVFGPILHVIRYKANEIDRVIDEINDQGYALTFGIHSRIQSFINKLTSRIKAGNVYVNRGTIGAVVGVQPFGGYRLSGTGPKAGGPQYLRAFATERVVSTDTTAAGGNASLVMLEE